MKLGYGHPARLRFETTISRVKTFEQLNPKLVKLVKDNAISVIDYRLFESTFSREGHGSVVENRSGKFFTVLSV